MKPRWKTWVEFIVALVTIIVGGYMIANVVAGTGPVWYWVGVVVVWNGLGYLETSWRDL